MQQQRRLLLITIKICSDKMIKKKLTSYYILDYIKCARKNIYFYYEKGNLRISPTYMRVIKRL